MTISETTDRVQEIGREFLKPMPRGWRETLWDTGRGWVCTSIDHAFKRNTRTAWSEIEKHEARGESSTPDEARRLCREEAERKAGQ